MGPSEPIESNDARPTEGLDRRISDLAHDLLPIKLATDIPELFAALALTVREAVNCDACLVSVIEPSADGAVLRDIAASVRPPARLHRVAEQRLLDENPVNRSVVGSGRVAEISGTSPLSLPVHREILKRMGFGRVLICPLEIEGEIIGTIESFRVEDRDYREDDWTEIAVLVDFVASHHSRLSLAAKLEHQYSVTLEALASALEAKDPYTQAHTSRISNMATGLATARHLTAAEIRAIRLGAILHDVGKIGIADSILLKPGPLLEEEWAVMRTHPELGQRIMKNVEFVADALPVIRHHHERWDGTGYPDGLAGTEIALGARIVAVCDAFDAMTTDRPYRKGMSVEDGCEEILRCAGTQFDPECAQLLVDAVRNAETERLERRFVRYAD